MEEIRKKIVKEMEMLSEMFGFDPPETSDELYVYHKEDYLE